MKRFLFLVIALILLRAIVSCSSDIKESTYDPESIQLIETKGSLPPKDSDVLCERLSKNDLDRVLSRKFTKKDYSLDEIKKGEDTIMYIVNYDGGGWAIVAGEKRDLNQIIAYCEGGKFNPEEIESPEVKFWYDMTLAQQESVVFGEEVLESQDNSGYVTSIIPIHDPDEEYYWVRFDLLPITIRDYSYRPHITQTRWGQGFPWNIKCKNQSGPYSLTGCVSVAAAQVLAHLRMYKTMSIGLNHTIEPTYTQCFDGSSPIGYYKITSINRGDYHQDSQRWYDMPSLSPGAYTTGTNYVSDLMIDIAERVGMKFKVGGSGAVLGKNAFEPYGITCDSLSYNFSTIRTALDNNDPVAISGYPQGNSGHAWIIDGYYYDHTTTDYPYKWVTIPADSLRYYMLSSVDGVLTESEKQRMYPNVIENVVYHQYFYDNEEYLLMNWGWDGEYDNYDDFEARYSISPGWSVQNQYLYRNISIFTNYRYLNGLY